MAKFLLSAGWLAILSALVYALGLSIGGAIGLPVWSVTLAVDSAGLLAVIVALTIALIAPFALAASMGRGYLPPIGMLLLAIFLAQVLAALGWGAAFPWAVPALASGMAGPDARELGAGSYLLVALTGLAGVAGTLAWWRCADQT